MLKFNVILVIFAFLTFCSLANARVLFTDDFEGDNVGDEPSKWEHLAFAAGNSVITISEDPGDQKNKVAKTIGIGLYIPIVAGREDWRDYIWEFDWMWENDSFVGTIYRVEDSEAHFHGSRRQGAVDVNIYTRNAGNWAQVASGPYPNENNIWYRHRLVITGGKHEIYLKERDDDTPFEELAPVVTADDDTFKKGPVGMMGITSGVSYFDNMIVGETPKDLSYSVNNLLKLTTAWGQVKNLR